MGNPRLYPDTFYVNGVLIPAAYFAALDVAQGTSLDGDDGGTWLPASGIGIGGAGMWCASAAGWILSPPSLQTSVHLSAASPLVHGDNDYIEIAPGHALASRSLTTSLVQGRDASGCPTPTFSGNIFGSCAVMLPGNALDSSGGGLLNSGPPTIGYPFRPGGRILCPLRVHNGATLASVVFWFIISNAPRTAAEVPPLFRVHKVDATGVITPLFTGASVGNGFLQMGAGPYAGWAAPQSYTYTCSAAQVIDTSQFAYFAEIIDESGSNAAQGNSWISAVANFTNITDMRPA